MKNATILRHVHFEDLGTLGPILEETHNIQYRDVGTKDFLAFDPLEPDLLIILGGPIGVYEDAIYPFLAVEKALIAGRLASGKPTLGICLGAQLIAAALGANVFPSGVKEIGLAPVTLTQAGLTSPLRHLQDVPMLHWHGDTYDLPPNAVRLASTHLVAQQAFAIGKTILGLQFHPEVDTGPAFERWFVGHASELAAAKIDIPALRADAASYGASLAQASGNLFREWLAALPRLPSAIAD